MSNYHMLRILVAEDNFINQQVTLRLLQRMGYRADIAANGIEVIQAINRQQYDVILMDIQMPDMDGVEATQYIRENVPADQQPRIIALTANALEGDRERYLTQGLDDYLSKPMQIDELVDALNRCQMRPLPKPKSKPKPPPKPKQTPSSPPFNMEALHKVLGDLSEELWYELMPIFIMETAADIASMHMALEQGQYKKVNSVAHRLKGACNNLSAQHMAELAHTVEQACKQDNVDPSFIQTQLELIEAEYTRVQAYWQESQKGHTPNS